MEKYTTGLSIVAAAAVIGIAAYGIDSMPADNGYELIENTPEMRDAALGKKKDTLVGDVALSEVETVDKIQLLEQGKTKYEKLSSEQVEALVGKTPYKTEVHEYVGPNGNGYQVIFYDTVTNRTKAVGYGPEAKQRTYDWRTVPVVNANGMVTAPRL